MESKNSQRYLYPKFLKTRFGKALLVSLILHILFLFWNIRKVGQPNIVRKTDEKIKVVFLDRQKNFVDIPDNLKKSGKKLQVVQNENTGKNEKPKDTRFLGEKDQTFERNTIAKKVGAFEESGKGKLEGARQAEKETSGKKIDPKKLSFDDLKMAQLPSKEIEKLRKGSENLGTGDGKNKKPGVSATNDYINDVPVGEFTNLNTIEFKYYGFYNRIRKRLEQYWGNSLRQKAEAFFRQGRTLSSEVKITSLLVTIDSRGNITKVILKSTSGVNELDDAAIESFNKAGPFPNPPRGMLINGEATIEWGFVVRS